MTKSQAKHRDRGRGKFINQTCLKEGCQGNFSVIGFCSSKHFDFDTWVEKINQYKAQSL